MYHIKSWRNRYRTDNVLPLFLRRLDETNRLNSSQKEWWRQLYFKSPLFQRALCIKGDYGSVCYSGLAEFIEAISHSNIVAARIPAVIFSLGTIFLAYLLGRALWDEALGLWLAAFFAIAPLSQVYAGLGRSHGMTQFALVALIYTLIQEQRLQRSSPWRLLSVALFGQMGHLTGWGVIGILVASELIRRYFAGISLPELARQTWWYAFLSTLLFGVILAGSFGTSVIGANVYYPGVHTLWRNICIASPFGHLAKFGDTWTWAIGVAWLILILSGLWLLFTEEWGRGFRCPFLITLAVSICVPFVASSGIRHMLIYGVMPTVLSAIGARGLFRTVTGAMAGAFALLVVFTPISLACDTDRGCAYPFILTSDIRYSRVADLLAKEMKPGDVWISWPYFAACPLYPYRNLPEPSMPITPDEFKAAIHNRPQNHACFVFMSRADEKIDPVLDQATLRIEYPNNTVLLKLLPPSEDEKSP